MVTPPRSNGIEVGDIFREFGPAYREAHRLPWHIHKAMLAIERCRTAILSGHLEECDTCGLERPAYNSCRNRHCPKCGGRMKEKWLAARMADLLPVSYFHIVFTLSDILNPLALINQRVIYNILFKAGSETLRDLGKDARHIGADIGFIAILHTWGQNLMDHPHLHCIVPGGGLSEDREKWVFPKKATEDKNFFIHVNVISDLFKKKFLHYLKKAYNEGELKFVGKIKNLAKKEEFQALLDRLYQKKWVTYCKEPFGGPRQLLEYLGRYTHRVAISNYRIKKFEDGKVTFTWRDYKDDNKEKLMTLDAFEFIRRFLLHILPFNFYRIRYYGILGSRNKNIKLKRCKELLCVSLHKQEQLYESVNFESWLSARTSIDPMMCPRCRKGRMVTKFVYYQPLNHAPPGKVRDVAA